MGNSIPDVTNETKTIFKTITETAIDQLKDHVNK